MPTVQFQYSTRTLMLATAFAACVCGAYSVWWLFIKMMKADNSSVVFPIIFFIPVYVPVVFIAYAAGRRTLSIWLMLAFVLSQAAALGVAYAAMVYGDAF